MDVFAHGLWSNAIFLKKYENQKKHRIIAVLFGVLPDLLAFAPGFIYMQFKNVSFSPGLYDGTLTGVFKYAVEAYNFTHSLVVFAVVALVITIVRKGQFYWPMLAWALHILMDLFTHPNFFPTPFLFPISEYRVPFGIPWSHPVIMSLTYIPLAIIYLYWYSLRKKKPDAPQV